MGSEGGTVKSVRLKGNDEMNQLQKPVVRRYRLGEIREEEDERQYWRGQSWEEKLLVLELLRRRWLRMTPLKGKHGDCERLQRVLRVTKQA